MKSQKKLLAKGLETKKPESNKIVNSKTDKFPIVGIGASAGGLEALEQFFGNMPKNSGMAFVVIQHLDPHHKGMMSELLQRITEMKVTTATDRLKVKPNSVYVIPPNKSMSILNDALHLFDPIETNGLRLPINFFFRSLALDRLEQSIGIVLSGMGSDGSLGLKAIKEKGGIVLVQQPESAKFDSMPSNAIKAVSVDIVVPANELPKMLLNINKLDIRKSYITKSAEKDNSSLDKIIILLRTQTGNDFSQYKKNTLYRRIERRMGIHQIGKIVSYVRFLQENPAEVEILFKELLIGVTSFFRDARVWEYLKDTVLPKMFPEMLNGQVVRAWVPGCSTGEEAYSLAIIFKEAIEKANLDKNLTLQIFATDLDSGAIEQARNGIYKESISENVSTERLNRFFNKKNNEFKVNAEIREMVVFATQNVIKDPPFTKLDILSCRNMLIYMNADLQKKLLALFHYSLKQRGVLVLGNAETIGDKNEMCAVNNTKLHIYQSIGPLKSEELFNFPSSFALSKERIIENKKTTMIPDNIQLLTDNLLLQQFSPASALVTPKGDILYITGNTGKYLAPAAGKASFNIFSMAREGLSNELPIAFRKARQNYKKVILEKIKIGANAGTQLVNITIQQIEKPLTLKGKILVLFEDVQAEKLKITSTINEKTQNLKLQTDLEQDLQRLNEELSTTREEMQTSQEELKSTNEELQSSNEELQSSNEELTTSKEEMQSLNEELHTVNAELQSKIDDTARANDDMNNLLNSSEIATLFLNKELKIRQFTVHATKVFKLRESDIGRPFTDLASNLEYPNILTDAKKVLRTLVYIEKTILATNKLYYKVRLMPYRTLDDRIDGLVITFIDITEAKLLEFKLLESQSIFRLLFEHLPSTFSYAKVIYKNRKSIDFEYLEVNKAFEEISKQKNIVGKKHSEITPEIQELYPNILEVGCRVAATGDSETLEYFVPNNNQWFSCLVYCPKKGFFVSINEDITKRKSTEDKLAISEKQYHELFSSMTEMFQVIELVYDSQGKPIDYYYRDVNPAFEKLVGKTRKQLIDKRAKDIFGIVEDYWLEAYEKVMKTGTSNKFENFGAELKKYYEINAWKASDKRVAIIFKDVTERKLVENTMRETRMMLRSFIEKVPSVIIGLSSNGDILEFNPEAEIVFGRKHSEVINKSYFELFIPKQQREKVILEMKQLLDGDFPNQFKNQVKSANGELLKIEWTAHKLLNEKGGLTEIITIGENITGK